MRLVISVASIAAVACMTGCSGCRPKPTQAAPSAQSSISSQAAAPMLSVALPPPRGLSPIPVASLPASSSPSPIANGDPIFDDITNAPHPVSGLDKTESFRDLGLHWSVPTAWLTEDYVPREGRPAEKRRTSHAPGNNAFFDVLEANVANQSTLMWKDNDFPPIGLKPDGGEERHDWTPFASVALGKVGGVGSHYTDASYTYAWVFFRHPRTKRVDQVILTWASGDEASRKLLAAVAASLSAD